ncbi:MAG: hypothetical protein OXE46_07735 [Chloroflexi bacterium]|nr:hypothetical protein [Chloroflexota bacterium]
MHKVKAALRIVLLLCLLALLALPLQAHDEIDASAFVSVRVYEGIDPADQAEIVQHTVEGFVPIISQADGFIAYFVLPAEDMLAAVNIFESAEQADASNATAADFVAENIAPLLPNAPTITAGSLDVWYIAALDDMMMDDDDMAHDDDDDDGAHDDDEHGDDHDMDDMHESPDALYGALRVYSNYDRSNHEEMVALVADEFVSIQQEMAGFFGYMLMTDGANMLAAMSLYDSEENALAANDAAADFVVEYLAELLPEDPVHINGQLGIAALADIDMGANLVGMMDADMDEEASE